MSPWQEYLWRLANPEAAERERLEGEPVVIQDECPATDGMTLSQLEAAARERKAAGVRRLKPYPTRARVRVAADGRRCHAVVSQRTGDGEKARCRNGATETGYCRKHAGHAPPAPKCVAVMGEGS